MVSLQDVLNWLKALQSVYSAKKDELTALDAAIGDADHGINMDRGFKVVLEEIEKNPSQSVSDALKTTAMALIKSVGGASGPLYGTFFLKASIACASKIELSAQDVVAVFEAGVNGIIEKGKARLLDKTMVDAWVPAIDEMKVSLKSGETIQVMLKKAVIAAEKGMKDTVPLIAKKGRASYLGDRSAGHQDAGATSTYYMLKSASEIWK